MIEFYFIGKENSEPEDSFQLKNLGEKRISMIIGSYGRGWDGTSNNKSTKLYTKVTNEDYDRLFADKLTKIKPPYEINKLLDYHMDYYLNKNNGSKDKFFKHIKYVIIPEVKKKKDKDVYVQLINEWVGNDEKTQSNMSNLKIGNINAPTQIQINSDGAVQTQTINYSNEDILQLFECIKSDLKNIESDLKEDILVEINNATKHLNSGRDISSRLLTLGGLVKDVGINVFANVLASPIYEHIKPYLGIS